MTQVAVELPGDLKTFGDQSVKSGAFHDSAQPAQAQALAYQVHYLFKHAVLARRRILHGPQRAAPSTSIASFNPALAPPRRISRQNFCA